MAVWVYLRGMCVLVFFMCRGVVALVSFVDRQVGRRRPHDPRDDELVLAA
jgi:hypothetical protein